MESRNWPCANVCSFCFSIITKGEGFVLKNLLFIAVRQRLPGFLRESPADGNVARRVKRAAGSIDKFSIRLGVFLRRYPIARVMVIVYMVSSTNYNEHL